MPLPHVHVTSTEEKIFKREGEGYGYENGYMARPFFSYPEKSVAVYAGTPTNLLGYSVLANALNLSVVSSVYIPDVQHDRKLSVVGTLDTLRYSAQRVPMRDKCLPGTAPNPNPPSKKIALRQVGQVVPALSHVAPGVRQWRILGCVRPEECSPGLSSPPRNDESGTSFCLCASFADERNSNTTYPVLRFSVRCDGTW